MGDMNCNELVERVTDCLEAALDDETLVNVLDHLQICQGCDDYFNQVLVTLKVVSSVPATSMSPELEANLLAIYRKWADSVVA